jgi:heptosyltransferase-2
LPILKEETFKIPYGLFCPMQILIIKLGAIGDVIRTTSVLPGLKEKYKDSKIDWVTKKESFDVLKNNNLIGKIYLIDQNIDIKNKEYDLIISLDDEDSACELVSKIKYHRNPTKISRMPKIENSFAKKDTLDSTSFHPEFSIFVHKKVIGAYLDNGKKIYTQDSSPWFDIGLISKFGKQKADELKAENKSTYPEILYKILGLEYKKQEPILILNNDELSFGKNFAEKNNITKTDLVIGINTGAGGRWQDKKLSIEETAELIDKLNNTLKNAKLLLFGGPEETERNKKIMESAKTKIIDAGCNNSLMEFASLVNLCKVLVTSDSLALHIGIALKKRIVSFFYPTSAAEIELYGRGIKIIGKGKSYCSYQTKCTYPPEWDIDEMVDAVKKLI